MPQGRTGYYTVSTDVYEQVRLHIYTVFPDGVTFEELQPGGTNTSILPA